MSTAIITAVFPAIEPFLCDYFAALRQQECEYTLVLINDGISLGKYKAAMPDQRIVELNGKNQAIANRQIGIDYVCQQKIDVAVFADSDDWIAPDRLSVIEQKIQAVDCVVNELVTATSPDSEDRCKMFSGRLCEGAVIEPEMLVDKNCCGMGNSAIRTDWLQDMTIPSDIPVADWYVFSTALLRGAKAVFTDETCSYYRQHDNNLVGGCGVLRSKKSLLHAVQVKRQHYAAMQGWGEPYPKLLEQFGLLEQQLQSPEMLDLYYNEMKQQSPESPFWWEEAAWIDLSNKEEAS